MCFYSVEIIHTWLFKTFVAFSKKVKICLCHLSVLNISFTVNMFWVQLSKTLIIFFVTHPAHKTLDVLELWNTTSPLLLKITLCMEKQTNLFCWNKDAFLLCSLKSIFSFFGVAMRRRQDLCWKGFKSGLLPLNTKYKVAKMYLSV